MLFSTEVDAAALLGRRHHLVLERLAAKALNAEDFVSAFAYADRRCRTGPPAGAHCFVLRAEAAWRLGRQQAAVLDLESALEIAPNDIGANRRMLAWANDDRRRAAAAHLTTHDEDPGIVRSAIAVLAATGERRWAAVSVFDSHVAGWIAWTGDAKIEATLDLEDGFLTNLLEPDPFHPLATREIHATGFRLRRPLSTQTQRVVLSWEDEVFFVRQLPANQGPQQLYPTIPLEEDSSLESTTARPTIIIPVYRDYEATTACFNSLLKARAKSGLREASFRILAVDDASPEAALRSYLDELATSGEIDLLSNPINLGFVGAINRALAEVRDGDVILLNADTVVAPGFVERLAAAAHSAPDIGTATPLSNNGDIFSFPDRHGINPMPDHEEVIALDQLAAAANSNMVIDVPSGIGFCLYITRACLDAVGGLSDSFERGYLEDVDFCLRARARGFRSVCAPSVFVGHHGSKSFQHEKRGLVLRNFGVLDQRFPSYRKECRAFDAADPLQPVRAAIERSLPPRNAGSVLIATAPGAELAIARTRAGELHRNGEHAMIIVRERAALRLSAFDGAAPQSITIELGTDKGKTEAAELMVRLQPSRLEITDPKAPAGLVELAQHFNLPIDLWVTSEAVLEADGLLNAASRLLAPTRAAAALARGRVSKRPVHFKPLGTASLGLPDPKPDGIRTLAIIPVSPSPTAWRSIRALAIRLYRAEKPVPIVVAGTTFDDLQLMSFPNLFVTGRVDLGDLGDVLAVHNPGWLLTDFDRPLFGHPLVEATRKTDCAVAYRDWSNGKQRRRRRDLAIAPDADEAALADAVATWIARY